MSISAAATAITTTASTTLGVFNTVVGAASAGSNMLAEIVETKQSDILANAQVKRDERKAKLAKRVRAHATKQAAAEITFQAEHNLALAKASEEATKLDYDAAKLTLQARQRRQVIAEMLETGVVPVTEPATETELPTTPPPTEQSSVEETLTETYTEFR